MSRQISDVAAQRMANRFELRNQIFHVLNQQQQEQYMKMVQQSLEGWNNLSAARSTFKPAHEKF